jgi:hypothetical protein
VKKGNCLINIQKSFSFLIRPDPRTQPTFLTRSGPLILSVAATWAPHAAGQGGEKFPTTHAALPCSGHLELACRCPPTAMCCRSVRCRHHSTGVITLCCLGQVCRQERHSTPRYYMHPLGLPSYSWSHRGVPSRRCLAAPCAPTAVYRDASSKLLPANVCSTCRFLSLLLRAWTSSKPLPSSAFTRV